MKHSTWTPVPEDRPWFQILAGIAGGLLIGLLLGAGFLL